MNFPIKREHTNQVLVNAVMDAVGLTPQDLEKKGVKFTDIDPLEIEKKSKQDPSAISFSHLEKLLEMQKKDIAEEEDTYDKTHPEVKDQKDATEIARQFALSHRSIMNKGRPVYAVQRENGAWAIYTRRPKKGEKCIPFTSTSLTQMMLEVNKSKWRVETLKKVKDTAMRMANRESVTGDERTLLQTYILAEIKDYTSGVNETQDEEDKKNGRIVLALLNAYADKIKDYRPGVRHRERKRDQSKRFMSKFEKRMPSLQDPIAAIKDLK